ncbi:MAG: TetR/AcrR family transcriptional regulator [Deltaproteobacteria bacterium]|nr:TetR/AcrR family transcriptional regulator [Deltaproteobacteria bacterium]
MNTKPADKRARILEAAVKVFARSGFFTATVAEIAREAGVADGTIYLYFKGKEDLLLRLVHEKMAELLAQVKDAVEAEKDAPAKLTKFITLHLSLVEKNPELAQVLIVELRRSAQVIRGPEREALVAYLELLAQVVRDGQASGELDRDVSPATVKRAVFGALDELALGWLLSNRKTTLKKTAGEVAQFFVRGLLPLSGSRKQSNGSNHL